MGLLWNEKLHTASVSVKNNYSKNTRSRKHKNYFRSEGAGVGPGDQPIDIGVEVLQCHLTYVLNWSYTIELKCRFKENPGYNQAVTKELWSNDNWDVFFLLESI